MDLSVFLPISLKIFLIFSYPLLPTRHKESWYKEILELQSSTNEVNIIST